MLRLSAIAVATALLAVPAHALTTFSAYDPGAGTLASAPNSTAAAAAFDAAVTGATIVDFEGSLGALSITGDGYVTNTLLGPAALYGYNTTSGGANFLQVAYNTVFNFSTPIESFGAYFTGVQRADATLTYSDGSTVELAMPAAVLSSAGTSFFGFQDIGASITSIDYFTGVGGDYVGVDDIRYATTSSVVPLPAALPLFAGGLGALGLLGWRRKRKGTALAA